MKSSTSRGRRPGGFGDLLARVPLLLQTTPKSTSEVAELFRGRICRHEGGNLRLFLCREGGGLLGRAPCPPPRVHPQRHAAAEQHQRRHQPEQQRLTLEARL